MQLAKHSWWNDSIWTRVRKKIHFTKWGRKNNTIQPNKVALFFPVEHTIHTVRSQWSVELQLELHSSHVIFTSSYYSVSHFCRFFLKDVSHFFNWVSSFPFAQMFSIWTVLCFCLLRIKHILHVTGTDPGFGPGLRFNYQSLLMRKTSLKSGW